MPQNNRNTFFQSSGGLEVGKSVSHALSGVRGKTHLLSFPKWLMLPVLGLCVVFVLFCFRLQVHHTLLPVFTMLTLCCISVFKFSSKLHRAGASQDDSGVQVLVILAWQAVSFPESCKASRGQPSPQICLFSSTHGMYNTHHTHTIIKQIR